MISIANDLQISLTRVRSFCPSGGSIDEWAYVRPHTPLLPIQNIKYEMVVSSMRNSLVLDQHFKLVSV